MSVGVYEHWIVYIISYKRWYRMDEHRSVVYTKRSSICFWLGQAIMIAALAALSALSAVSAVSAVSALAAVQYTFSFPMAGSNTVACAFLECY